MNSSEVARVLARIEQEYLASLRGLEAYAVVSRHDFIEQKQANIGDLHSELQNLVGNDAIRLIAEKLDSLTDGSDQKQGGRTWQP